MRVSASIELIWQLAAQEAIFAKAKEIEPGHFFMAILKVSELPVEGVDKIALGANAAKELAKEVNALRDNLVKQSIDSTPVRRKLRIELGKGNYEHKGGSISRSQRSREIFDDAARLADIAHSQTMMPIHLTEAILTSPTPAIVKILGETIGDRPTKRNETPLLDLKQANTVCFLDLWLADFFGAANSCQPVAA